MLPQITLFYQVSADCCALNNCESFFFHHSEPGDILVVYGSEGLPSIRTLTAQRHDILGSILREFRVAGPYELKPTTLGFTLRPRGNGIDWI